MGLIIWNSLENNNADSQENNETERHQRKSRKLSMKMFSLIYLANDANHCFSYLIFYKLLPFLKFTSSDSFCTTCCIFSAQIALQLSQVYCLTNFYHKVIALQIFIWIYEFFKNHPQWKVFCSVYLTNLKYVF